MLQAIAFGTQQDFGLELVQNIPVPQHECDGAILSGAREIDTELSCGRMDPRPNLSVNLRISLGYPRNSGRAYICELRHIAKSGL
jgi:hypothetical protein